MTGNDCSSAIETQLAPLFRWQKTNDFDQVVTKLDELVQDDLLTDGRWKPLREALILRDFAQTLGYDECRLDEEEFPDGQLRSLGVELRVEITEVLTPGRERDKEYKEFKDNPEAKALVHHDCRETKEANSKWIEWVVAAIKKKLKYSKDLKFDIVVYNNIDHLFELNDTSALSNRVGELLAEAKYQNHWVWQVRSTTIDLLWPRLLRLKIPNWKDRF